MSTLSTRIRDRLSTRALHGIALLVIFGIALALRVSLPYENVFTGDWVSFGVNDPWYHMRLVENLVQHFPQRIAFDAFTLYPFGQDVPFAPFFDLLLGFFVWVIGLGSPTEHTIQVVGAYFPAILGALVTVPVYFIGKELFNRNAGLLAAGLIAILPGEFLFRSLLGFTDHHIAEVLLSTTAALFLILAIKSAREKEASFSHIWTRDWRSIKKPLIFALLAGLTLGMYLLSWVGALLFVFIIVTYMIVQYIIDHLRGKSTDYLCIIGVPSFLVALLMVIPFTYPPSPGKGVVIVSLAIGMLAFLASSGLSGLIARVRLRRLYYPLAMAALGLAGLGFFYLINPSLLSAMLARFSVFTPSLAAQTIAEVQPLLFVSGVFTLDIAWQYFTTCIFIALVALGLVIYAAVRDGSSEKTFLIIWCLIMLVAMLSQRRFAYYFAVNVALLTGYLSWRALEWSYFRKSEPAAEPKKPKRKGAKKKEPRRSVRSYLSSRYPWVAVAAIVVFFVAFYPNIVVAIGTARDPGGPNEDWHSSLLWMRDNTPDPFGDPDFYYGIYARPPPGETYDYPESAYGVMSWWDYGHWITAIAHRIPNTNPFQAGVSGAAAFFTAEDEASASEVLDDLGSRYVIIDYAMATSKFYAMAIFAGESKSRFFEVYYQRTADGSLVPIMSYYPEYYRSMCSRLYNFAGEAVVPDNSTWVISYEEKTDNRGTQYKEVSSAECFATFEEAEAYLESQTSGNHRIVGDDPFISPVPLEELEHYELVYRSDSTVVQRGHKPISYVEIFEYLP